MINKKTKNSNIVYLIVICLVLALFLVLTGVSYGQTGTMAQNGAEKGAVQTPKMAVIPPVFKEYRGIAIGMSADEVRDVIDKKPRLEDKSGFYYVFSDDESAQIELDTDKKVRVISITFSLDSPDTPTFAEVFGKDVPGEPVSNGTIYKRISYPEAGFWVAYSRSAGENPTVSVTIQRN